MVCNDRGWHSDDGCASLLRFGNPKMGPPLRTFVLFGLAMRALRCDHLHTACQAAVLVC